MYKRTPLEKRLRKRGQVWSMWGYDYAGERYTASTHQTDRKAALEAARKIERDKSVPPTDSTSHLTQTFTLAQALELLDKHDRRTNAADSTIEFHENRGRHLVRLLKAETPIASITLPMLNTYTDERLAEGADRHTIQKEHRVLRQVLGLAKANGMYGAEPKVLTVEGFDKPKGQRGFYKPGQTWLKKADHIAALIAHTSENPDKHRIDRRDDIQVFVNLGLRRRELLVICPEHVDLENRLLHVRELEKDGVVTQRLKTDESQRDMPLNDAMVALFSRRLRNARAGAPLFVEWGSGNRDLKSNWRRARASLLEQAESPKERADLDATLPKSLNFNDLRRTFCSQMKNAGVSLKDCAELLGHSDDEMVRLVYGHTDIETLRAAVAKLPTIALPPPRIGRTQKLSRRHRLRLRAQARATDTVFDTNPAAEAPDGCPSISTTDTVFDTNPMRETGSGGVR